ncbi:MAG: ABC transporter ATP-binding protein, partial [Pseudopedobacter sp.]|nr:ABC transporter ATP-binding protein [Deinococcales bacterium]
ARALAPQPRLMLLDEPFSNLDAALRSSTRAEVRSILKGTGVTTVLVTHDQEEALSFADRIALMRAGRLEQVGTPREVYAAPRTVFCASFLGRTNLMQGQAQGLSATTALGTLELSEPAQGLVMLSLRPEQLELGESGVVVVVQDMEYLGTHTQYTCTLGNMRLEVRSAAGCPLERGDYTRVRVNGVARVMHG